MHLCPACNFPCDCDSEDLFTSAPDDCACPCWQKEYTNEDDDGDDVRGSDDSEA